MNDRANSNMVLAALDEGDSAIVVLRPDSTGMFRIVQVNGTYSRITNYTSVEAINSALSDLRSPSTNMAMQQKIDEAMKAGKGLRGEIEYKSRVGRLFWFGFTLMPIVDPDTRCLHCVLLGRDITEKRIQDSEQLAMQTMLALVFQRIDAPVVITRANGFFLLANTAWQELLGYRAHEVLRLTARHITAPAYQETVLQAHTRQFKDGKPYHLAVTLVRKDGTLVPVHLTSTILQRADMQRFRIVTLRQVEQSALIVPQVLNQAVVGRIQFIGLDAIKEAYGPRWGAVGERLLLAAEKILKRRLSVEDVLSRTADQGFSIWFKEGTEEENSARVTRIGREIRIMLLGELEGNTQISVCAYAQVATIEDPAATLSSTMTSLDRLVGEGRLEAEQQAKAFLERMTIQQPRDLIPLSDRSGRVIKAALVDLPRDIRGRFASAMSLVAEARADVDTGLFRLGLAAKVVLDDVAQGRDEARLVTIPFGLFATREGREQFLQQWRSCAPSLGQRLVVMLSELPPKIGHFPIIRAAGLLGSVVKRIGIVLDDIEVLPLNLPAFPFSMVALMAESLTDTSEEKLRSFIKRMHEAKARVLVLLAADEQSERWLALGADLTALS